jgi:hypothetical protein
MGVEELEDLLGVVGDDLPHPDLALERLPCEVVVEVDEDPARLDARTENSNTASTKTATSNLALIMPPLIV